jgi:RecB family exonuclease
LPQSEDRFAAEQDLTPPLAPAPPPALSFTALEAHARCGYRYYVEEVLGLPPTPEEPSGSGDLAGAARGAIVHELLERLDFAAPAAPARAAIDTVAGAAGVALTDDQAGEIADLTAAFAASPLCARLADAERVAREERFSYLLGEALLVGALDVLAWEGDRALVVDYKTNRLLGRAPAEVVEEEYTIQRLAYALALLRAGAAEVEVAYCFLERPEDTVAARFAADDAAALEADLTARASGLLGGEFRPSRHPHRELCLGCPARPGLCVHPTAVTGRAA